MKLTDEFLLESMEPADMRNGKIYLKCLEKKTDQQPRILYLAEISFKNKGQISNWKSAISGNVVIKRVLYSCSGLF